MTEIKLTYKNEELKNNEATVKETVEEAVEEQLQDTVVNKSR